MHPPQTPQLRCTSDCTKQLWPELLSQVFGVFILRGTLNAEAGDEFAYLYRIRFIFAACSPASLFGLPL